ncbi:MAG TPA: class I mannose-6-phosphate isomerase [Pseudonocardia sp.]|nr:class I mannose-6-phosphate isomerase [Pseudonocardia sp.]
MRPLLLPPNVIDHFYRGGERLAALRGVALPSPFRPEEWLAATVHRAGVPGVGSSSAPDGTPFAGVVAADPVGWTGVAQPPAGLSDTGLLVKLLDAGQRLPVHVHPTRPFARDHLHSCYGKTEAWYVLETAGEDAAVWVGFGEDVDPRELAARVEAQDAEWMLARMNELRVRPGDGVVVPAGQVHATGAGVFLVEAQEPTDFSILLEWSATTASKDEAHLGLGLDVALPAVDHRALEDVGALHTHVDLDARGADPVRVLAPAADPYFRLDLVAPGSGARTVTVGHGFAVAIVLGGGEFGWSGGEQEIARGQVYVIPDGIGDWTVGGGGSVVVCRPARSWPELRD